MSTTSQRREWKIRREEPIELFGLTFYPIKMRDYDIFLSCKDAFSLRQATFPVDLMAFDYISAVLALEIRSMREHDGKNIGAFQKILRLLYLSLRLDYNSEKVGETIRYKAIGDNLAVDYIEITQNETTKQISAFQLSTEVKSLIAKQNGIDLPDESENINLVKANEQKKELKGGNQNLKIDIDDLIDAVAYQSKLPVNDILEWTVSAFERRRRTIERDKKYTLCASAELSGMTSFKNGNPCPSWAFDLIDDSLGTVSLKSVTNKLDGGGAENRT